MSDIQPTSPPPCPDLIDHYARAGLISNPTRHFRPCYGCGERFHPDDMHTIDIEKYGEHDTAEICDGCKESHLDAPRIADIDLDLIDLANTPVLP